mgnify:CR=1 FL=1
MNYVYIITDFKMESLADKLVASPNLRNCRCYVDIYTGDIGKINTVKMKTLCDFMSRVPDGNNVLKLDVDIILNSNPFGLFEEDVSSDVILVKRQYKCRYKVNSGVVGFRANKRSRDFLLWFCKQLESKSWTRYSDFQMTYGRGTKLHWLDEQDLFCVCAESTPAVRQTQFDATIGLVRPKWNWTCQFDNPESPNHAVCVKNMLEKIGDSSYPVLHFKGGLKKYIPGAENMHFVERSKA